MFLALWCLLKEDDKSGIFIALQIADTFCVYGQVHFSIIIINLNVERVGSFRYTATFRNIINLESTIIFLLNFFSEDFPEIFSRRERERAAKRQKRIVRRRGENEDGKFCLGKM